MISCETWIFKAKEARDAPLPERLFTKSRDFDLREAKAGSVSADDLIRKRQQEKTGAQETEIPEEPSLNADTAVLREREPQPENGRRHTLRQHGKQASAAFSGKAKAEETPAAAPEPKRLLKLTFDAMSFLCRISRTVSSRGQGLKRSGQQKSWKRPRNGCRPTGNCAWNFF